MSYEGNKPIVPAVSKDELIGLLKGGPDGVAQFMLLRAQCPEWLPDLSGANLCNIDLSGADFSGAKLTGAQFIGANLENVNFSRADLSGARFNTKYTRGVNWWCANIADATGMLAEDVEIVLSTIRRSCMRHEKRWEGGFDIGV